MASIPEKFNVVRVVPKSALNLDVECARFTKRNSEFISKIPGNKPKSRRDKFNEAAVKGMCGKVNDEIKQFFYINCDCNAENEVIQMKLMKQNHEKCIKLFNELFGVVDRISDNLIKDPNDFMLSFKDENFTKTSTTQSVVYPKRIDEEPPIIVLGPHGTEVPEAGYVKIRWKTAQGAARMLCALVFDRTTLLMTNFSDTILDPCKVSDIEYCVKAKTKATTEEIHKAIAKKCHDTHIKFMKYRLSRGIEF